MDFQKYSWSDPVAFVEELRDKTMTAEEKNLIATVILEYRFSREVLNVLLELILTINDQTLHPTIVHSIASNWKKGGIVDFKSAVYEANQLIDYFKQT